MARALAPHWLLTLIGFGPSLAFEIESTKGSGRNELMLLVKSKDMMDRLEQPIHM